MATFEEVYQLIKIIDNKLKNRFKNKNLNYIGKIEIENCGIEIHFLEKGCPKIYHKRGRIHKYSLKNNLRFIIQEYNLNFDDFHNKFEEVLIQIL
ncbi:MAG: hypothetical protein H7836_08230 [Magnetococcus sp. YQC-3]